MCGDSSSTIGALIVAGALVVFAFFSHGEANGATLQPHAMQARAELTISLSAGSVEFHNGNFTLEVAI